MRVLLNGEGEPIPIEALPDLGSGDLNPAVLIYTEDDTFDPSIYTTLGYTHYEILCVGAAGGRGGNRLTEHPIEGESNSYGGGGGGGGLHRAAGALDDLLPGPCAVVVGQVGADGQDSNREIPTVPEIGPDGQAVQPYVMHPNPIYVAAEVGEDGGASSFNGTTCRASGGKGGSPTEVQRYMSPATESWEKIRPGGDGGDGGIGGQTTPGGGAVGAVSNDVYLTFPFETPTWILVPAESGSWDGTIGEGGGGGRGGNWYPEVHVDNGAILENSHLEEGTAGGQGSFSFADTSKYGPRQNRGIDIPSSKFIVPGSGGGAKPKLQIYGSHAISAIPDGVVYIRLTQLTI